MARALDCKGAMGKGDEFLPLMGEQERDRACEARDCGRKGGQVRRFLTHHRADAVRTQLGVFRSHSHPLVSGVPASWPPAAPDLEWPAPNFPLDLAWCSVRQPKTRCSTCLENLERKGLKILQEMSRGRGGHSARSPSCTCAEPQGRATRCGGSSDSPRLGLCLHNFHLPE